MKYLLLPVLTCTLVIFLSASAMAQDEDTAPPAPAPSSSGAAKSRPKGTRTQKLNFEDELVEGGTQKPELFYLFQKKNFNYKRLIKLRQSFIPEMRKTSEDIQRIRGGT